MMMMEVGLMITTPDWQLGNQWYRMMPPAGQVIPETSLKTDHCGTALPGWIRGSHPIEDGHSKKVEVCFSDDVGDGDDCRYTQDILVTKCGEYLVYYLPETPSCQLRYCSANSF